MRKTIVDVIRKILATYTKPVGFKKFCLKCFEFTALMMDTVVMKYFRYDMRCIDDRWNLNVSFK